MTPSPTVAVRGPITPENAPQEGRPSFLVRLSAPLGLAAGSLFLILIGLVPLPWPQQAILGLAAVLCAVWLRYDTASPTISLALSLLAAFMTFRYAVRRILWAVSFFHSPHVTLPARGLVAILLLAEVYAVLFLLLRLTHNLGPLRRAPVLLPDDLRGWPVVDVVILAHREPLAVIRSTVLASLYLDWPADKLRIHLLDDGRRDDLRLFAEQSGVAYRSRAAAPTGWAANLDHALPYLSAPFLAVFHAGHVPTRSFLQVTMGWFLRDSRLALLQTADTSPLLPGQPHRSSEQAARDTWNAVVFTGSAAVLRHAALQAIGGVPSQTTAPGLHTSLRLQRDGWHTAFLDLPQAAPGLAGGLARHAQQRASWNRGVRRIMALDRPLFTRGLTAGQRLSVLLAQVTSFSAAPRLIFLTVPPLCLLLGVAPIPGFWPAILAYALPYLALAGIATHYPAGSRPFLARLHETALAPHLLHADGRKGKQPSLIPPLAALLAFNFLALLAALPRVFHFDPPLLQTLFHHAPPGTFILSLLWCSFNALVLGASIATAEQAALQPALPPATLIDIILPGGAALVSVAAQLSPTGAVVQLERPIQAKDLLGASVQLVIGTPAGKATLPATVLAIEEEALSVEFCELTLAQHEHLTLALYAPAHRWTSSDAPSAASLRTLFRRGWSRTPRRAPRPRSRRFAPSIVPLTLLFLLAQSFCSGQSPSHPFRASASAALSAYARLTLLVARYPWAATLVVTLVCIFMANLLGISLRHHAARRLAGASPLTSSVMPPRDTARP